MTAIAILGNGILHASAGVTTGAIGLRVCTQQCKAGFFCVIELGRSPADCRVTLSATTAAGAAMHIIRCMAAVALRGRTFVVILHVAGNTGHVSVLAGQSK